MNQPDTQSPPKAKRKYGRKILLALMALLAILLTLLPVAIQHFASALVKDQGITQLYIGDVDLNLFTGSFGLENVQMHGEAEGQARLSRLYVNVSMLALLRKRLEVEAFELENLTLDVNNTEDGEWIVAGIVPPTSDNEPKAPAEPSESEPWGVGVNTLAISAININFSSPKLTTRLRLDSMQLQQLASWLPEQMSPYQAQLHIDEAPLQLSGELRPFTPEMQFNGKLTLQNLPLALADAFARDAGVEQLAGHLSIETDYSAVLASGQPQVTSQTHIRFVDVSLTQGQYMLANQALDWQGKIDYQTPDNEQDLGLRLNGTLGIEGVSVQDTQADLTLAGLKQLQLQDIQLASAQQLSIPRIQFKQLTLLSQETKSMLHIADTQITEIEFDGQQTIGINQIEIAGLAGNVHILKDGEVELLNRLQTSAAPESSTPKTAATENSEVEDSQPWRVKLAQLRIAGDSEFNFRDESVEPVYHTEVKPLTLTLSDIDTAAPDQDVPLKLQATINQHSTLDFDAQIKPFGPSINMVADGKLSALELPPASPYVNSSMGYYLKRGQLNSTLHAVVENNQLDAKVHVLLKKFNLEEGDPSKAEKFSENLSMPLDSALNLLRDKEDNIELDIEINGDINDPQFDIGKIINKALANATKSAVATYLKVVLQPWGALLIASEMIGKQDSLALESITFQAGAQQLSNEHQEYLAKIVTLLQERPGIDLNICGHASEADRQALITQQTETEKANATPDKPPAEVVISNEQLLALVNERMTLVKEQLRTLGIDPGRLLICHPTMEDAGKNSPQVLLSL